MVDRVVAAASVSVLIHLSWVRSFVSNVLYDEFLIIKLDCLGHVNSLVPVTCEMLTVLS